MASYIYFGPASGTTLKSGREVLFYDGKKYDLPADDDYIKSLVAQKYLAEPKSEPKAPKAAKEKEKA